MSDSVVNLAGSSSGVSRLNARFCMQSLLNRARRLFAQFFKLLPLRTRSKEMGGRNHYNTIPKKYENIGPTAGLVAYYRACSDIPFAKQIAQEINAEESCKEMMTGDALLLSRLCVAFEARFKSIDAVLRRYPNITNFVEIPAGFSSRGISTVKENPKSTYIECDLAQILKRKKEIATRLLADTSSIENANLSFEVASILDADQLKRIATKLPGGPIAIITEGLFSYLTAQERTVAANNVHELLIARNGVWIVTDITRLFKPDDANASNLRERISNSTGFSPITGCFASNGEAKRFFKSLGFKVSDYRRSEVIDNLSTRTKSGMTDRAIKKLLKPQATFALEVMR